MGRGTQGGGCCGAATRPVPPSPLEQAPPQHPTAPSARLMIHSCSSEAVNHQSPSPSCESPGCSYACSYLFKTGEMQDAEQLSGCRVPGMWLQLKYHNYFPALSVGEAPAASWDQERAALKPLSPHRGKEQLLQADLSHPPWTTEGLHRGRRPT